MTRFVIGMGVCVLLAGCGGTIDDDLDVSQDEYAVVMSTVAQVFCAVEEANHGRGHNGRVLTWKEGNYSAASTGEQPTCDYGWCGPEIIQPGCNSTVQTGDRAVYYFGGCNSTSWGEQFAATMWHGGERLYPGYSTSSSYAEGVSGTTTFGWHPYWTVSYNGTCRTLQGWSYEGHCSGGATYTVTGTEPAVSNCRLDFEIDLENRSLSGASATEQRWTLTVPSDGTKALVAIFGGSGDADLYVKRGSPPTTSSYDCRPYRNGNEEECTSLGTGTVYILIRAYSAFSGVTFLAAHDGGGTNPPPAVCGNGTCESGETCSSCPGDCGVCPPVCGNGACESGETCSSCPGDCGVCPPVCGNGTCESGETCSSCATDCGSCSSCPVMSYSTSGTSSASYTDPDTRKFSVGLTANVTYTIGTCSSTTTDTYLRLHKDGVQKTYNDDGCSYQSKMVYTPSVSGTYVISAGCYSSYACSGTVTVSPAPTCN